MGARSHRLYSRGAHTCSQLPGRVARASGSLAQPHAAATSALHTGVAAALQVALTLIVWYRDVLEDGAATRTGPSKAAQHSTDGRKEAEGRRQSARVHWSLSQRRWYWQGRWTACMSAKQPAVRAARQAKIRTSCSRRSTPQRPARAARSAARSCTHWVVTILWRNT